uniref:uncharacterized protein n=1 Tax=Myxine glutinosa TaxID=7769 RepID=UPI00358F2425
MAPEIEYLGHHITRKGIFPSSGKLEAIKNAPAHTNVSELRAFLGMLTDFRNFLQNLSTVLEPLHILLRKCVHWKWGSAQEKAFRDAKTLLCTSPLLVHYDIRKSSR